MCGVQCKVFLLLLMQWRVLALCVRQHPERMITGFTTYDSMRRAILPFAGEVSKCCVPIGVRGGSADLATKAQAAAAVAAAFPPRGGIRLLGREHTQGDRAALERIIGEEYILDSIRFFDGDRVESAVRLATGATAETGNAALTKTCQAERLLLTSSGCRGLKAVMEG